MAGILYQSMLKAASSGNEGSILFAGIADRMERASHANVGTASTAPQPIEVLQLERTGWLIERRRWEPGHVDRNFEGGSRMAQSRVGGQVNPKLWIVIADDSNFQGLFHGAIHLHGDRGR